MLASFEPISCAPERQSDWNGSSSVDPFKSMVETSPLPGIDLFLPLGSGS